MIAMRIVVLMLGSAILSACGPAAPPPPDLAYEGLPVAGTRAFAERLGFTPCFDTSNALRCRKERVSFRDAGPFRAAVDLAGRGDSGFRQVTLWHDTDQNAFLTVSETLRNGGWHICRTGREDRGDQAIWRKAGEPVRISIDLSYWGKRRLRLLPEQGQPTGKCW